MRKNGFKLVSLIKIVGILGIVFLVSGFLTFNTLDKIRKRSFVDVSYGIITAAQLKYAQETMKGSLGEMIFTFTDGVESNDRGIKLDYRGDKPKHGIVKVDYNGQIYVALFDGKYCANKEFKDSDINIKVKNKNECYKSK